MSVVNAKALCLTIKVKSAVVYKSTSLNVLAGEEGGLEFMFDVCNPNRPIKGGPYIVSRNVHKRQRFGAEVGSRPSFPPATSLEFLRCFFTNVYPFLPVLHAGEFITKYSNDPGSVSSLLLWSVFLATASHIDADTLRAAGFKTRKQLKEYCYQHAKTTYDAQLETDKTTIIASTLLIATWYVDLEDLDGCGYWIAIAIHLCFSIGLHREPNYARLPRCPFPAAQRSLWRRLWWCAYSRDAWFSLAGGRPMRVHIDDCDLQLPTVEDITEDFKDLSPELRDAFMPPRMDGITELWIRMLHLSVKLEHTMVLHYRPRRPPLSVSQLESDYTDTLGLLTGLEQELEHQPRTLTLHMSHFKTYVNAVVIVLHRSYVIFQPKHLSPDEQQGLAKVAAQACRTAAAEITTTLNMMVAENMIETSPPSLLTPIIMAMQIHFYELARSEGLLKQHALHNMNLHFMILKHLKKTFWIADLNHNLFTECVKALDGKAGEGAQYAGYAAGLQDPSTATARSSTPRATRDDQGTAMSNVLEPSGLTESAFDEFFASFGPFDNFSCLFEDR